MGRGTVVFAIVFLIVPLLAILGAWALPAYALGLTLLGLTLLLFGVTLGIPFIPA